MIKDGNVFFVRDIKGQVNSDKAEGLFYKDIRYISDYKILWNKQVLHGEVKDENNLEKAVYKTEKSIYIEIDRWIDKNSLHERIILKNKNSNAVSGELDIRHSHDFKDIFIIRNFRYGERGETVKEDYGDNEFILEYLGRDNIKRGIHFKGDGRIKGSDIIQYQIKLTRGEERTFHQIWTISDKEGKAFTADIDESVPCIKEIKVNQGYVYSGWMENLLVQSLKDITRLKSYIGNRGYIAAGVPLYSNLFGRDSIIAGLQLLNRNPEILKETLELLAIYQGREVNNYLEEEPGKILHELREGELANTKQVPFYPYYGSIDSTPLFLIGIAEYFKVTDDIVFLNNILGPGKKALKWIDEYGDRDGDGFVEYIQLSDRGSNNHGWKDSSDSMVHKDGTLAKGAIALSEVQGYIYKAKLEWGSIFKKLGDTYMSLKLRNDAELLKKRFNEKFWMGDYFAMALDGYKNKLEVVSSNPLHCLFCGIIDDDKIPLVIKRAFKEDMFSKFGIRTLSNLEKSYNPLSYHNGSIWPHDNSLIALGLKKYGYCQELVRLAEAIFNAGNLMKNFQIPELYGGEKLMLYEHACVPQAWAAGAIMLLNDLTR